MATTEITVTIPDELAVAMRQKVAAGHYGSVSAYITLAAQTCLNLDPLDPHHREHGGRDGRTGRSFEGMG